MFPIPPPSLLSMVQHSKHGIQDLYQVLRSHQRVQSCIHIEDYQLYMHVLGTRHHCAMEFVMTALVWLRVTALVWLCVTALVWLCVTAFVWFHMIALYDCLCPPNIVMTIAIATFVWLACTTVLWEILA